MNCVIVFAYEKLGNFDYYLDSKIDEIKKLINTIGWKVLDTIVVKLRNIDPGFYITRGKVQEIKSLPNISQVEYLVFCNELTPVQIRNLERELGKKVVTKIDLILMIFKNHAISMESKLQVELASLQVQLPRLYGVGKNMEQIRGGIGLRGPGERKTEVMKRHIKEKIRTLKEKIQEI
ncbi:MAG: hypothetical protein ACK4F9_04630, partial [Brevinematia bacterium]